jgi:RHH-type proline utilization regulon transcriptional repressor/proline dehydrogenase/delta 1-pyrroline-5-carboxylate dehydrogenase
MSQRALFKDHRWQASSLICTKQSNSKPIEVFNPSLLHDHVGTVTFADEQDVIHAITTAQSAKKDWQSKSNQEHHDALIKFSQLLEHHTPQLFALLTREAGKSMADAMAEVREAVDFSYYYARQSLLLTKQSQALGVVVCISPWNFPLAIFAGQILAALAAGNVVIAKPSENTNLIAALAVQLMHKAGINKNAIQLVLGEGAVVGHQLSSHAGIDGICFTGSTQTAQKINKNMAEFLSPKAPLVAETGGLNAMIVDGTALPEQVVRDVMMSAFQSAGQRCSALRMLYIQDDIADTVLNMLSGAMDELNIGDPWQLTTDIGPVIDAQSKIKIDNYCKNFFDEGKVIKQLIAPSQGHYVAPCIIEVAGIGDLKEEIFGPVLHVARFKNNRLEHVVEEINQQGYGLTFSVHSRIKSRVNYLKNSIKVGNIYVNRNQIGAVVASQPFGGEGLSGTGPKAGGPLYVNRFRQHTVQEMKDTSNISIKTISLDLYTVQTTLNYFENMIRQDVTLQLSKLSSCFDELPASFVQQTNVLPGPTGEDNTLRFVPKGLILCLGPDPESLLMQVKTALSQGNQVLALAHNAVNILMKVISSNLAIKALDGVIHAIALKELSGFSAVASNATNDILKTYRLALSERKGPILPLIVEGHLPERFVKERHVCEDTTASGGNATLLATS